MVKYDRIAFSNANALIITKAFVQCIYALDKTMNQHVTILRPVSPMHESTREINQKPQNYHIRKLLLHKLLFLYTYKKWRIIYMIDTVGKMAYTCYLLSPLNY